MNVVDKEIIVYAICWCKTWQFRSFGQLILTQNRASAYFYVLGFVIDRRINIFLLPDIKSRGTGLGSNSGNTLLSAVKKASNNCTVNLKVGFLHFTIRVLIISCVLLFDQPTWLIKEKERSSKVQFVHVFN